MEALLIDSWLGDLDAVPILDSASVSVARERVREVGRAQSLPMEVVEPMVLVASELARNQLAHAQAGRVAVRPIARGGVPGIEVIAADRGPGIVNPARALEGAPRPSGSLGVGLASACDLAFETDFDVRLGEGTCVWARKFGGEVTRRRQIGIFGKPIEGERRSGDHACFARLDGALTVGVCDGLGHGALAREASDVGVECFKANADRSPVEIIEACHEAMQKTRGAVMAVVKLEEERGLVEVASVGNVSALVYELRNARRFGGSSFVLGAPQKVRKVYTESVPLGARQTLVVFTDGVRSNVAIEDELDLLHQPAIVVAASVLERFGREGDDALVLVAR